MLIFKCIYKPMQIFIYSSIKNMNALIPYKLQFALCHLPVCLDIFHIDLSFLMSAYFIYGYSLVYLTCPY